ncbi:killer cell lectin-like receptor subfamily B member 1B allele B [Pseudonaja textilis]|uniref:killer cell lectin-like receptor subfamily B member 1B allele B n=1 Tax=Pseudonaja textilis TaxID=8673 RepID=UPI000EAA6D32|nr:killer cell lectin-like receptor subfamily B member 1B allele B [Pseudonaja textilis]
MEDEEGYLALNIQARKQQSPISVSREPDRLLRYRCYRWIITGAGCIVVSLLVGAVIALRICAFQRRQYKEAFDKSVDSQETSNGTEIKHRLENVVSRLQTFLCKQVPVNSTEHSRCHLCPGNWSYHDGKCYWISKEPGTWDKSQEDCRARGAQMLVLKEQEEMTFIQSISGETQSLWIGLIGIFPARRWMWVDDSPLNENLPQELGPLLGDSCGMLIGPKIVTETCSTLSMWVCQAEALDINTPLA